MSKAHAKKFVERADEDKVLQKKIQAASDSVLKLAKKHGYNVSRKELRSELAKKWGVKKKQGADDPYTCFFSEPPSF